MTGDPARIILTTTATYDDAQRIAEALVSERLAACVNIVANVRSVYWWEGAIQRDDEQLLLIKTTASHVDTLRSRLHGIHPYELPEFVVLSPHDISPQYLSWLQVSTTK